MKYNSAKQECSQLVFPHSIPDPDEGKSDDDGDIQFAFDPNLVGYYLSSDDYISDKGSCINA